MLIVDPRCVGCAFFVACLLMLIGCDFGSAILVFKSGDMIAYLALSCSNLNLESAVF